MKVSYGKLFDDDFNDYLKDMFFHLKPAHVASDSELIFKPITEYHNVVDGTIPLFATDGHGNMQFGAGNPATGYEVQSADGLVVFSKVIHRQGSDVPQSHVHGGEITYDATPGGQPGNPTYADWNWNFGIAASGNHKLSEFNIHMKVSVDGKGFLDLVYDAAHHEWDNAKTHVAVIQDGGGALNKVDENSENIKFFKSLIDAAKPTLTGHEYDAGHDYQVQIIGTHHNDDHVIINQIMHIPV